MLQPVDGFIDYFAGFIRVYNDTHFIFTAV